MLLHLSHQVSPYAPDSLMALCGITVFELHVYPLKFAQSLDLRTVPFTLDHYKLLQKSAFCLHAVTTSFSTALQPLLISQPKPALQPQLYLPHSTYSEHRPYPLRLYRTPLALPPKLNFERQRPQTHSPHDFPKPCPRLPILRCTRTAS